MPDQSTYIAGLTPEQRAAMGIVDPVVYPRVENVPFVLEELGWVSKLPEPVDNSDSDGDVSEEEKTAKYQRGVIAVLTCKSHRAAALQIGITCRQLSNWKADPLFKELLEKTKQELYGDAVRAMRTALMDSCMEGAQVIRDIAHNEYATDGARVQAAKALVDYAIELHDIAQIRKEIELLKGSTHEASNDGKTFARID